MKHKLVLYLYLLLLTSVGTMLTMWIWPHHPLTRDQWIPLLCFTAFLVGVELFEIKTAMGGRWLPSSTIDVAVIATLGPIVAIAMEILGVAFGDGMIKRKHPLKLIYNAAAMSISVGTAGVVFHAIPWGRDLTSPLFLVPAIIAYAVFSAINMTLAAFVVALSEGRNLVQVWRSNYGWHFLSGLLPGLLSAFLIFSYKYAGLWSLLLFSLPLFIVWRSHKLFEEMKEAHINTVAALTTALEADEPYTHGHSYRVAKYATTLGRELGMSERELEILEYGGLLHDIGKIAITNDIVCKPARLTKEEFDILAAHPAIGGEIVSQMKFLREAADMVRHHHERPDGQGYPDGLTGEEISQGSHILNVCDAIDAMTSNRPYRAALSLDACMSELTRFRGTQFDIRVVDTLERMVNEGSFTIIPQTDGSALEIQRILREAAQPFTILPQRDAA
jgi:putative nucleotidyltransferase with HDIG domain